MDSNTASNRHTACAGIHGEWSNKTADRPIRKSDLFCSALVLGGMYLVMCIGAANGF
jgi:hypothetical protein